MDAKRKQKDYAKDVLSQMDIAKNGRKQDDAQFMRAPLYTECIFAVFVQNSLAKS